MRNLALGGRAKCLDFAGEGWALYPQGKGYSLQNAIEIRIQFVIGKAKDTKAILFEALCARGIIICNFREPMLPAIEFDDELAVKANEVGNVRANRLLAAKFETVESTSPQCLP